MIISVDVCKRNNICIEGNLNSKNTIVFGHGFGSDQTAWQQVKGFFEQDYKLVLYDNVGAGLADMDAINQKKYQSLNGYAEDLVQICDSLNLRDAIYVGHSASGMVGLLAIRRSKDIFGKIVLVGASPRYLNDDNYIGGFLQEDLDTLFSQMSTNYYKWAAGFSKIAMKNEDRPFLQHAFADSLLSLHPDIALAVSKSIFLSDFRPLLKEVEKEVLIIQSASDIAVPMEVGEYLHSGIRNSKLIVIEGEGHFPHISEPEQVAKAIADFLENSQIPKAEGCTLDI